MSKILQNVSIQIKYVQYYMMIFNCTDKCYEHTNLIIENRKDIPQLPDITEKRFIIGSISNDR